VFSCLFLVISFSDVLPVFYLLGQPGSGDYTLLTEFFLEKSSYFSKLIDIKRFFMAL